MNFSTSLIQEKYGIWLCHLNKQYESLEIYDKLKSMNNLIYLLKRSSAGLIVPVSVILLSSFLLWKWPQITFQSDNIKEMNAFLEMLPVLPYLLFLVSGIMGWRYNNTGLIFSSLALSFVYFLHGYVGDRIAPAEDFLLDVTFFLFPVNMLYFSFLSKRRLFTFKGFIYVFPIVLQVLVVFVLLSAKDSPYTGLYSKVSIIPVHLTDSFIKLSIGIHSFLNKGQISGESLLALPSVCSFVFAFFYLLIRFILRPDANLAGLIGILSASFLGFYTFQKNIPVTVYFSGAGLILIVTTVESSFKMAYIDDLTGLPGRRSLNEMLLNLGNRYAIAMVDVDHFKKFNDTYGHETGDQVLKMIASRFGKMTGGAKSFRYGGEEFTAIFNGKSVEEAVPHLETFRKSVQDFPFIVRGKSRPKNPNKQSQGKTSPNSGNRKVKVTVSIGVCEPEKGSTTPEKVIKNADKALYKAKKSGRNCIKSG